MRTAHQIILASTNLDKFLEFQFLVKKTFHLDLIPAQEMIRNAEKLGLTEKHDDYTLNALAKARVANQASHFPCLADDSGLEIKGLGGKPGVRSRRYAIPKAGQSQTQANIQKVLEELRGKSALEHEARFFCAVALVMEGISLVATGFVNGTILDTPRGDHGFGYDSIFVPSNQTKTFAEMTDLEKHAISHRAQAIQSLAEQIQSHGIIFGKP